MTAQFSPLSPVTMEGDNVTVMSTNTKQASSVEECLFSLLRQLLKAVMQSVCSCQRVCDTYVLPCSCCKMSEDPMLGGNLPASGRHVVAYGTCDETVCMFVLQRERRRRRGRKR